MSHDFASEELRVGLNRGARGLDITCSLIIPLNASDVRLFTGVYYCLIVTFGHEGASAGPPYDRGTFELRRIE